MVLNGGRARGPLSKKKKGRAATFLVTLATGEVGGKNFTFDLGMKKGAERSQQRGGVEKEQSHLKKLEGKEKPTQTWTVEWRMWF